MTPTGFVRRVTVDIAILVGLLALAGGAWLATLDVALGILAGGALGIVNLRWIARGALAATATARPSGWRLATPLRLGMVAAAVALLFAAGRLHPVGVVIGLSVLPLALIVRGLAAAKA